MERTARSKAQTFAIQALLFPIISIVVFVIEIQSSNDLLIVQVASVVLVSAISFILAVAALSRCQIEEKRVMLPSIIGLVVSGCLLCIFIVAMCVGLHQNAAHRAHSADTEKTQ
jgi:glucose uptake protein GlcU